MEILRFFRNRKERAVLKQKERQITRIQLWDSYEDHILAQSSEEASNEELVEKYKQFLDSLLPERTPIDLEIPRAKLIDFHLSGILLLSSGNSLKTLATKMDLSWPETIDLFERVDKEVSLEYIHSIENEIRAVFAKYQALQHDLLKNDPRNNLSEN